MPPSRLGRDTHPPRLAGASAVAAGPAFGRMRDCRGLWRPCYASGIEPLALWLSFVSGREGEVCCNDSGLGRPAQPSLSRR